MAGIGVKVPAPAELQRGGIVGSVVFALPVEVRRCAAQSETAGRRVGDRRGFAAHARRRHARAGYRRAVRAGHERMGGAAIARRGRLEPFRFGLSRLEPLRFGLSRLKQEDAG
jgi:hypothetical protein